MSGYRSCCGFVCFSLEKSFTPYLAGATMSDISDTDPVPWHESMPQPCPVPVSSISKTSDAQSKRV